MTRTRFAAALAALCTSLWLSIGAAAPITQVVAWGTLDPGCTNEHATCAADPAFVPSLGGYRAGGSVSWSFVFDTSAFASIASIELEVLVVGFWDQYPGNIDPGHGQLGNFLAVDGVPFAPFTGMTDGRDARVFDLLGLAPGPHTFTVVAYGFYPGPWLEGWAGVDVAKLTVKGEAVGGVPEPATAALAALALAAMAAARRARAPD